jgi:hypothetical protein
MKLLLRAFLFISLLLTLMVGVSQTISALPCRDDQDCGKPNGPSPRGPTPTKTPIPAPGPSAIENKYAALGGEHSFLGTPTLPTELKAPDGIGRYRHYENGSIYWSPSTGAHEVHGLIREKWASLGWEKSYLGYPTSDELATPDGVGRYSQFQNGIIYWTPQQGALDAPHPILNVSLVKEQSKPDVFLVVGGYKLWIRNEHEFTAAGFTWDKVQVVPDGALNGYQWHFFSAPATIKPSDVFVGTESDCKSYPSVWGGMRPNCQNSANLIRKDVVVAGWLVSAPYVNKYDYGVEDIHYNIMLDPNFIDRMYGPGGLSAALDHAVYPGNPYVPDNPLPFEDLDPSGGPRGVDYGSFIIANNDYDIHGELNAWHVNDSGRLWTHRFVGRGTAPGGWRNIAFGDDSDTWWPWDVMNPDGRAASLQKDDYVVMRGALWQDGDHEDGEKDPLNPWNSGYTRGHSGWTEIHPVDWIVRVNDPGPPVWKSGTKVKALSEERVPYTIDEGIWPRHGGLDPTPYVGQPLRVLRAYDLQEIIDGRFTQISTVLSKHITNHGTAFTVQVTGTGTPGVQGRFKASYIATWIETNVNDVVWVEDNIPAGAAPAGSAEGWNWSTAPTKYGKPLSGTRSHESANVMGIHQHFFYGATEQLPINSGDTLIAYVYLDPKDIPYEVMLQWNDGTWEHRAYWGANFIPWGQDGTASRRYMGPIEVVGEWIRLEVPAGIVGLEGRSLNGMAFTVFGGRATWDRAGKCEKCSLPPSPLQ